MYCTEEVLAAVAAERTRQDEKWGEQNHLPPMWMAILGEEFGETCQEALRFSFGPSTSREKVLRNYREELIQVAAVAVAAVECLDRNEVDYLD